MIEWMKEILGDAYTEDIDNKITARLTADYAPKADLEAANTAKSEALTASWTPLSPPRTGAAPRLSARCWTWIP